MFLGASLFKGFSVIIPIYYKYIFIYLFILSIFVSSLNIGLLKSVWGHLIIPVSSISHGSKPSLIDTWGGACTSFLQRRVVPH